MARKYRIFGFVSRWRDRRRAKAALKRTGAAFRNEAATLINAWSDYRITTDAFFAAGDPLTEDMPDVEYLRDRVSMAWAEFEKALRVQAVAGRVGSVKS